MTRQIRKNKTGKESGLSKIRHSAAHALAAAVLELYPDAKLGIGPATNDGFYYDFDLLNPITPEDLSKLEQRINEIIQQNLPITQETVSINQAIQQAKISDLLLNQFL